MDAAASITLWKQAVRALFAGLGPYLGNVGIVEGKDFAHSLTLVIRQSLKYCSCGWYAGVAASCTGARQTAGDTKRGAHLDLAFRG
jgi:hypothetical protein